MSKKILVLSGSPRKKGNTDLLCDEFIRGANENNCTSEKIYVIDKNIKGCIGCGACQINGGSCSQKDDMQEIYEKIIANDIIVFSSPVYFYSWTSQIKAVIDRTFAIEKILKNKTFYLISAGAAPEEKYMKNLIDSFNLYISCFRNEGIKNGGYVIGYSTSNKGDVIETDAMKKAYELGITKF